MSVLLYLGLKYFWKYITVLSESDWKDVLPKPYAKLQYVLGSLDANANSHSILN